MSYQSDMEFLKRDQEKPKKIALLLLKITVIALAVMILITAVAAPVVYFTELLAEALGVKEDANGK